MIADAVDEDEGVDIFSKWLNPCGSSNLPPDVRKVFGILNSIGPGGLKKGGKDIGPGGSKDSPKKDKPKPPKKDEPQNDEVMRNEPKKDGPKPPRKDESKKGPPERDNKDRDRKECRRRLRGRPL